MKTVTVSTDDLYSPRGQGEYSFSVEAPVLPDGDLDLNETRQVSIFEGPVVNSTTGQVDPYTSITFVKDQKTGAWAWIGSYMKQKYSNETHTTVEASVLPVKPHEAKITEIQLQAAFGQAVGLVNSAEAKQATGILPPAFTQPIGTEVNLLK